MEEANAREMRDERCVSEKWRMATTAASTLLSQPNASNSSELESE